MFQSMLVAYAILVLCNVAPEAPSNIEQEKIQAMLFEQHLITVFTYVYTRYFMLGKKKTLYFLYYENQLKLTLRFYPATGQTFYQTL